MDSIDIPLRVAFLPFAAPGHMIPMMHIARQFTRHAVDVNYITTPANAARFQQDIDGDSRFRIHTVELPCAKVGLPPGVESFDDSTSPEMFGKLHEAFGMLSEELERILREIKVDFIVSDAILTWTTDAASRLGIPRLVFRTSGCFSECINHTLRRYAPHEKVASDEEPFELPGLPHKIEMTRSKLPDWLISTHKKFAEVIENIREQERKSYGVVMHSFYELEPDYVEYYRTVIGLKTWVIGPGSLWDNKDILTEKDKNPRIEYTEVMEWLNSKDPNSVLYISFGSMAKFSCSQLIEIAHGLEESGCPFIWVVRMRDENGADVKAFPEGFEERMKGSKKGLIIRNWAPQLLILNHPAVAGFFSHCGWNSTLESVCAGQPLIAWPMTVDQFYNEKLITHILRIGVSVGVERWCGVENAGPLDIVGRDQIARAVTLLMGDGKEVKDMRDRARQLALSAKKAISKDGSSHTSLMSLISEIKSIKLKRQEC